jgi:hypothetical protein
MKATELRIGSYIEYFIKDSQDKRKEWWEANKCNIDDIADIERLGYELAGYRPIELTEEWLVKFGFIKKDKIIWKGNGYDYQPETSKTTQLDYVLSTKHDDDFIFRYENFHYRGTLKDLWSVSKTTYLLYSEWYERTNEGKIPCDYEIKYVHQLQNIFWILTGEELTIK